MTTVGILGGGQLARMTARDAVRMGLRVLILHNSDDSPAAACAHEQITGDLSDVSTLIEFARRCDVVTLESEFFNEKLLAEIESAGGVLRPTSGTVGLIQDKLRQKSTLQSHGLPVAEFEGVDSVEAATEFGEKFGVPYVLKSRRGGYDGYGNATINESTDLSSEWDRITEGKLRNELYCEAFVPFDRELATIVVRSTTGESTAYPIVETIQRDHICHTVKAPADIDPEVAERATTIAVKAVESIDGHGVFGVELFQRDGELLVNELAPRPHNSGHYTIEGCVTSQFENHVRAVLGWPIGSTTLRAPGVVMVNVLGRAHGPATVANYAEILRDPGAHVHIYGKSDSRPGRKLGHVTTLDKSVELALERASRVADMLRFEADGPEQN